MRRFIPVITQCVILLALVIAQVLLCGEVSRVIPNVVLIENAEDVGILVGDYLAIDDLSVSAVITGKGMVSSGSAAVTANLLYTDSRYGGMTGLRILKGTFLSGGKNAVISDGLASRLFLSQDILGAKLEIEGRTFTICGVYRNEASIAAKLSENGIESVFLPLDAYPDGSAHIKTVYCRAEDGRPQVLTLERAARELGTPLNTAVTTNYAEAKLLALQSKRFTLFLIGILAAGSSSVVFIRHFISMYRDITIISRAYSASTREQIIKVVWKFVPYLFCGMATVLILWIVLFDAYLPSSWMQGGFSFKQFAERFILETQKLNASEYRFLDVYIRRVLIWLYTLDLLILLSGSMLIRHIVALRKAIFKTG